MNIWELFVIALVALIVIGPKQLPTVAQHLGNYWQRLQQLLTAAKQAWQQELKLQELNRNLMRAQAAENKKASQAETPPHE